MKTSSMKKIRAGRITRVGIEALVPDEKKRAQLVNIGFGKATKSLIFTSKDTLSATGGVVTLETSIGAFSSDPALPEGERWSESYQRSKARNASVYSCPPIEAINRFLKVNDLYLTNASDLKVLPRSFEIVGDFYSRRSR